MKRKVVSVILATAMVASMVAGCGGSNNASTNNAGTTTDAAASDASSDTSNDAAATEAADAGDAAADAATDADASLADKKVGVCIYQFSDNFMTLFRTELENYLVEKGFSKDNITIVDGANDNRRKNIFKHKTVTGIYSHLLCRLQIDIRELFSSFYIPRFRK